MSAPVPHARYEELVAGYALSALEPEDEQELVRHLASCAACERDLAVHRETLAHLAYAADDVAPPPALWDAIRRDVEATSGREAFHDHDEAAPAAEDAHPARRVGDLAAAREKRVDRSRARRAAAWTSVAAGVALIAVLGVNVVQSNQDRDDQARLSDRLAAAVQMVETGPGRTVPLTTGDGRVTAVAVVQDDRLSLIVDGLAPNDATSSVYVLWGSNGVDKPVALATFDVSDETLDVVQDVALPAAGGAVPEVFVLTQELGRTAPPETHQPALATGRAA